MPQRNLYIIGGVSQVGKSKTAAEAAKQHGHLQILSTDALRPNGDNELAWKNVVALLESGAIDSDTLIEGVAVTPEKVHMLNLKNFAVRRVAFIGYTDEAYENIILAHAHETWMGPEMERSGKGDRYIKDATPHEIAVSRENRSGAEKFDYKYFDALEIPYEKRVTAIVNYLFENS